MTKEDKIRLIQKTDIFGNLSTDDCSHICELSRELHFKKGSIIFEENTNADGFYIIGAGIAEILKKGPVTNQWEILATKQDGDVFGEMAIIDDLPRSASVRAKTDMIILKMSKAVFNELLTTFSHIAVEVARNVCYTIRSTNRNYIDDLEKRNRQLKIAYRQLKKTQNELIQVEKLSVVGKFASIIIHDIKNPMSNIKAYAELIKMSISDNPKAIKSADVIINEVDRLNKMTSELLEFSRGEFHLNKSPINFSAFITTMIDLVKQDLNKRNITITFPEKFDTVVIVDVEKMKRVFLNLIGNASEALLSGGKIVIRLINDGNWLKWSIQDNGFGMEEEVLNKIFDPFYSYNKKGGTGLGMTIVKSIIEKHGGYIKPFSKKNHGTRFDIYIPKA